MSVLLFERDLPELFSWEETLAYLDRTPLECLFRMNPADQSVIRLIEADGLRLPVRLSLSGPGALATESLTGEMPSEAGLAELREYVADWFDLDRNLAPFYERGENDAVLGPLLKRHWGLRIVGIPDLFEALCWAILGQQVNLAFAYLLKQRLTEAFGEWREYEGERYPLFPKPEALRGVTEEELMRLKLSRSKARTVLEVARRIDEGLLSREELLALPSPEDAGLTLTAVKGIGPWTAAYVRMRCLRDPSAFPIGDVGLHNAVRHTLGTDRKPTIPELLDLFAGWTGWEAYATFYLWRVLY
ncbi:DNA-3-methyladenine glycosylase family protein [Paenibacillus glufosinatiresistens]|uniref:DNA-3-methyladenine glycosylase family protein n=1 Tax=Paenibacillus glufosinatiresistens TaxID=3070657 RepID=UPI00286DEB47|nr:DNA-3-methyladenine glycosylase [Paenibacillus sp. YX.27]